MKQTSVKVSRAFYHEGKVVKEGTVITLDNTFAAELISNQKAVAHDAKPENKPSASDKK